ncbi:MAG: EAL domain-containing protein [Nautiliaceae bacterium]
MKQGVNFKIKLYLIIIFGLSVVALIYKFNTYTQSYFLENNKIQKEFSEIKGKELKLKYNILITGLYMYVNNDLVIQSIRNLRREIKELLNNSYFKFQYPQLYKEFLKYNDLIDKKVDLIYEFETLNAPIKNSIMYLANLLDDLPEINVKKNEREFKKNNIYAKKTIDVISSIFLARNSFDKDFIKNLDYKFFENYKTDNEEFQKFNKVFVANLNVFVNLFPRYVFLLKKITDNKSIEFLEKIQSEHLKLINDKIIIIKIVSYVLMTFVLFSMSIVVFLMFRLQRDYTQLKKLNEELHYSYTVDKLTGLYNRNKFEEDLKVYKNPLLFLVNIDKFKNINDYYGVKIGDEVLKKVASYLKEIVDIKVDFYRLGADDFGILCEKENVNIEKTALKIINFFDKKEFLIDEVAFHISVSIGISSIPPLIENADIALKNVKKSSRIKYMIFDSKMDVKSEIEKNIKKANILYKAISQAQIVPYFQPIVNTFTKSTEKYEVLARIIHDFKVESIYPYLQIAKDNKLYADITELILMQTYEILKENKELKVNVNVSIDDILDDDIFSLIKKYYLEESEISRRITFEILESEAVNDYKEIREFVSEVKKYNASVAIDDFGSGYSNFEHLINLDIDYLKVDGSLIKNIHTNKNAYEAVKIISLFAKNLNVKTVAEFVANKEIYEKVKEIGLDYSQGFYFSEPKSYLNSDAKNI